MSNKKQGIQLVYIQHESNYKMGTFCVNAITQQNTITIMVHKKEKRRTEVNTFYLKGFDGTKN